jgi:hypothetical protein
MRFQIDRAGRTVVASETDSALRLLAPPNGRERIAAALGRVRAGLLSGWAGRISSRVAPRT